MRPPAIACASSRAPPPSALPRPRPPVRVWGGRCPPGTALHTRPWHKQGGGLSSHPVGGCSFSATPLAQAGARPWWERGGPGPGRRGPHVPGPQMVTPSHLTPHPPTWTSAPGSHLCQPRSPLLCQIWMQRPDETPPHRQSESPRDCCTHRHTHIRTPTHRLKYTHRHTDTHRFRPHQNWPWGEGKGQCWQSGLSEGWTARVELTSKGPQGEQRAVVWDGGCPGPRRHVEGGHEGHSVSDSASTSATQHRPGSPVGRAGHSLGTQLSPYSAEHGAPTRSRT